MIDLHVHTTYSDGLLSPKEVVQYASEKELSVIAITDHDCVSGVAEAVSMGQEIGVEIIQGVEMSTSYNEINIHILGLMIDTEGKLLNDTLTLHSNALAKRFVRIFENFISHGYKNISYDEFAKQYSLQWGHLVEYMRLKKIASNLDELKQYVGKNGIAYAPYPIEKLSVRDSINAIHDAGGVAIWAHPLHRTGEINLEHVVKKFKLLGLDGLEVFYPFHTQLETEHLIDLALKYKLLISGGSDFHERTEERDLGKLINVSHNSCSSLGNIWYVLDNTVSAMKRHSSNT